MTNRDGNKALYIGSVNERRIGASWMYPAVLLLVVIALVVFYWSTALSIVGIWMRSNTYAHGFLIVPISAWLVWERRGDFALARFQGAAFPLFLLLLTGVAWLVANVVDVAVVQQFAFVLMIICSIWAVVGTKLAWIFAFPLFFLLFGVPAGESLVPPLMEFTADFTVAMLKLTGIPVYREGYFFSIPSGDWSVVEACSGFRYLIASVTLGTLFAYLTYQKWWKRALFIGLSIVMPILANGMRAYLIVIIGHLSDMRLAVGMDHLVYGWVFFGIIIALMFAVGGIWRDQQREARLSDLGPAPAADIRKISLFGILAVLSAGMWPFVAASLDGRTGLVAPVEITAPEPNGDWKLSASSAWDWQPHMVGVDGELVQFYNRGGVDVALYLGVYRTQRQGAELVNSENSLIGVDSSSWRRKATSSRTIATEGENVGVKQDEFDTVHGEQLLVWSWYRLGDRQTDNSVYAKILDALNRIFASRQDASLIAVSLRYRDYRDNAVEQLSGFVGEMLPAIEASLDQAAIPET